jgi:putative aminopeptidase FrvX
LKEMSFIPALSGHEHLMRDYMKSLLSKYVDHIEVDQIGNLIAKIEGKKSNAPRIMVFAHMDQLGFVVRKIEKDGFIRIERLGGVPEKVLPGLRVLIQTENKKIVEGIIGNKSHHMTPPDEKYTVPPYKELYVDIGASSDSIVRDAGIFIGCPVVYKPSFERMMGEMVTGTSIDNRGGCAALVKLAQMVSENRTDATLYIVGSVQEEFNLRGAMVAAQSIKPDCAICLDIAISGDTPDLQETCDIRLGDGPVISMYNFHGRGTLNGSIPSANMVRWAASSAEREGIRLQRGVATGILTDASYVQLVDKGIPILDIGFPSRYSHSPVEMCHTGDLIQLVDLLWSMVRHANSGTIFGRE